jgi:hypothetical protein
MAVNLSPVGGVAAQFFTNDGVPLTGGMLYSYLAGTSTPATTYTSSNGNIAHSNPIVLDSAGRVPTGEIWLTDGINYKFVLKDANDVLIATYDNISGINSNFISFTNQQEIQTATAGQTVFTLTTMQYQPGTNSLSVFVDGVNQYGPGAQYAFTETNITVITFVTGLHVGASVKFTTSQQQGAGAVDASQVSYNPPFIDAVSTNVEAKLSQYVSVMDFGAVGDGSTDDTVAIQSALDTQKSVFVPSGEYVVSSTLRLTHDGQMFYGEGDGPSTVEPPETKIVWNGALGGTIISVGDNVAGCFQNCTIQNMMIDGNSLALVGVEGYQMGISAGGAWRNRYINLYIVGLTGVNSTGIFFGTGPFPEFAHDAEITGCFIQGAERGSVGSGAIYRFTNTTFSTCKNAIVGNSGSAWTFNGCVFSNSVQYDFNGTNIQVANFNGCWFEDSLLGIYIAATAHTVNFSGCYLQTKTTNTTQLMDMGSAAGNFSIKGCFTPVVTGSNLIKNVNATTDYDVSTSNVSIDPGYILKAENKFIRVDNGAFAAGLLNNQTNLTGDGTSYSFNTLAWVEDYDVSSWFNASTGIFTALLYGYFQFNVRVAFSNLGAGHTSGEISLVVGSNEYILEAGNYANMRNSTDVLIVSGSVTAFMNPSNTAYLKVKVSNSTKTVGVFSGNSGVNWRTRFEGRMI